MNFQLSVNDQIKYIYEKKSSRLLLTIILYSNRVEEYVQHLFKGTGIVVEVVSGQQVLEKEYPCFAAVNRAASVIPRHDGRVIWLTYTPDGPVEQTLMLVGKGVTYDTGGADIKAGGKRSLY